MVLMLKLSGTNEATLNAADISDQQSNSEKKKQPVTKNTENTSDDDIQDLHLPRRSRPKRQIRKPVRYLSNSEYGH